MITVRPEETVQRILSVDFCESRTPTVGEILQIFKRESQIA